MTTAGAHNILFGLTLSFFLFFLVDDFLSSNTRGSLSNCGCSAERNPKTNTRAAHTKTTATAAAVNINCVLDTWLKISILSL